MRTARQLLAAATAIALLIHLAFAFLNRHALAEISIQLRPGVEEHKDKTLLGIGKTETLPDYEVIVLDVDKREWNLGFKKDVSARSPVTFAIAQPIPLRNVQTIIVRDKDTIESDVLDTASFAGSDFETDHFSYRCRTEATFHAFSMYFFDTPLGIVISAGIILGLAAVIVLTTLG